jgi:hypothetical protein
MLSDDVSETITHLLAAIERYDYAVQHKKELLPALTNLYSVVYALDTEGSIADVRPLSECLQVVSEGWLKSMTHDSG